MKKVFTYGGLIFFLTTGVTVVAETVTKESLSWFTSGNTVNSNQLSELASDKIQLINEKNITFEKPFLQRFIRNLTHNNLSQAEKRIVDMTFSVFSDNGEQLGTLNFSTWRGNDSLFIFATHNDPSKTIYFSKYNFDVLEEFIEDKKFSIFAVQSAGGLSVDGRIESINTFLTNNGYETNGKSVKVRWQISHQGTSTDRTYRIYLDDSLEITFSDAIVYSDSSIKDCQRDFSLAIGNMREVNPTVKDMEMMNGIIAEINATQGLEVEPFFQEFQIN